MKNNQLHELINNLQPDTPELPQFQQRLRRTVLSQPRHRSRLTAVGRRFFRPAETGVRQRQKLVGLGSAVMVVALLLSVGIYSYHFSPKAVAEQAVDQGLVTLNTAPSTRLNDLFAQLGGDPKAALREAKAAKDLTTISKAEFQAEQAKAPGIFAASLGAPGQPQTVAFGIKAPNGQKGAVAGGVMASGSAASGVASSAAPTGPLESGTVSVRGEGTVAAGANGPTFTTGGGQGSGSPGPATTTYDARTGATNLNAPPADFGPVKLPEPATYLRYTDGHGRVVVLSLDKDGLPVFKTVFMKPGDLSK